MITTPGQLNHRAEFYHQLGALLTAGMSAPKALESLFEHPPTRSYRSHISPMIQALEQGMSVDEAFGRERGFTPEFDLALIEAGSNSGRLDVCFKLLSSYYRERARLARQTMADLLYPVFLIHFAALIFPAVALFMTGDFLSFLVQVGSVLLPIYVVGFFLVYAFQGNRGLAWRSTLERILAAVPVMGSARRDLALSRLSAALESLLNAGVPIIGGWQLAAAASGSPAIARTVTSWSGPLDAGSTPAELVSQSSVFPETFASLYHTGEMSGTLDETLRRLQQYYQEEGYRKMRFVSEWSPRIVYMIVAMAIGARVIIGWSGYFGQLNQLMQ